MNIILELHAFLQHLEEKENHFTVKSGNEWNKFTEYKNKSIQTMFFIWEETQGKNLTKEVYTFTANIFNEHLEKDYKII